MFLRFDFGMNLLYKKSWFMLIRGNGYMYTVIPCPLMVCLICTLTVHRPVALGPREYISGKPFVSMV